MAYLYLCYSFQLYCAYLSYWFQAKVVCNQLGFSYVLSLYVNSHFGPVFPPYSYETLSCKGHESSLDFCSDFDSSFCSGQYAGAGVICSEVDISKMLYTRVYFKPESEWSKTDLNVFILNILKKILIRGKT